MLPWRRIDTLRETEVDRQGTWTEYDRGFCHRESRAYMVRTWMTSEPNEQDMLLDP
jgi:hypothetical protein